MVQPVRARALFPFVEKSDVVGAAVSFEEDDFPEDDIDDPEVSLDGSLSAAGLMHIIHGAGQSLATALPELDEIIDGLQEASTMCRLPATRERLIERCFSGIVGRTFHKQIRSFKGKVYRDRWGRLRSQCSLS